MAALTAMTPPSAELVEVEYKRYRSKRKNDIVTVLGVKHSQGAFGWYSTVTVQNQHGKRVSWPAPVFLRAYEPVGRKLKIKTIWQRIRGKDLV